MSEIVNIDVDLHELDTEAMPVLPHVEPAEAKARLRFNRNVARRRFITLQQHTAAVELLDPLPGAGESLHGAMSGHFSGWQLATAIVELLDVPIDELIVSTLGFNRQNAASLYQLLDSGKVKSVLLNVSDYFRSSDREIFSDIKRQLENRGQRVAITRCHAKLLLFQTGGRNIVCEMSANLRSSQNFEQFSVCDDADLLAFHRKWILDLIEQEAEPCEKQKTE